MERLIRLSTLDQSVRSVLRLRVLHLVEAGTVGLLWIQGLRFLIGSLYSHIGSASVTAALDPSSIDPNAVGVVHPAVASNEISFLVYMIALPLLVLLLGRVRWLTLGAVVLAAAGRALMVSGGESINPTMAASLVLGGGLVYIGMLIRQRAQLVPHFFILGLGVDQLFRAWGNTLDPTWSPTYANVQIPLSIALMIVCLIGVVLESDDRRSRTDESGISADQGLLTIAGAVGLGGLLFLEISLLSLPNAIAGRAGVDYTSFFPAVIAATLLPLVPWVRKQARGFVALFDSGARGWLWMLIVALLMVVGTRFQGIVAGAALVIAQFAATMMWWWFVRPQAEKERNPTGFWLIMTVAIFGLLIVFDNFTYDYAFVREFGPELRFLNDIVPPILRGFRGMGLAVMLLAVFLAGIPMVQTRRRIPWMGGHALETGISLLFVAGIGIGAALVARPPLILGAANVDSIRIGTYEVNGGFSEFFNYDLEALAQTIDLSGAEVVLLQGVEAGRVTSFGVDQPLWLARRLGMDVRFFPTNEGLQGLAVLSEVEIVFDDGRLLPSTTFQTGLQRVQVRPDAGVITLYNTWLAYAVEGAPGEPLDDSEQVSQLNEVIRIIAQHHPDGVLGRTVVAGTFNNIPDSRVVERIRANGFVDPFAGYPIELAATLRRTGLRARFDYIWVRNLTPVEAGVMDGDASDHRMAVAQLLVTR